jgi:hypothetical protein
VALFLSNCGRLGKGEKTESAIVISPLGEEAEDAILLELVTDPMVVERAIAAWAPRFHGHCAGTVMLLGQFFKLVVI